LLAHAGALCQIGDAVALQRQMARDVDVRRAHFVAQRQVGQRQRRFVVLRHQAAHPCIELAQGVAQQAAKVRLAPCIVCMGRYAFQRHSQFCE